MSKIAEKKQKQVWKRMVVLSVLLVFSCMMFSGFSMKDENTPVIEQDTKQTTEVEDRSGIIAEGSAGKTIRWTLTEDGTLCFEGNGPMDDCEWDINNQVTVQPWDMYQDRISSVIIQEGISYIGKNAFRQCKKIARIEIPSSVADIGWCAFNDCRGLKEFVVDLDNSSFTAVDGVLFDKSMKTLIMYPAEKEGDEYSVPVTVERIMNFSGCNLKRISFPDSVTTIDDSAFADCNELTDVILPRYLEAMRMCLFWSDDSLSSITIPKSVKNIYRDTIFLCSSLKDVYYEGSEEDWDKITIDPENDDLFFAKLHFMEKDETSVQTGAKASVDMNDSNGAVVASKNDSKTEKPMDSLYKKGDIVTFGCYEQDNREDNGKEKIDWLVLDIQDDKVLLISKYVLDCRQFHDKVGRTTWESCTLREWLNEVFLNDAFSKEDQKLIQVTDVLAERNPMWERVNPGENTEDKVFLLSISEFQTYFSDNTGQCEATEFARRNEEHDETGSDSYYAHWWLRSPGATDTVTVSFHKDGYIALQGRQKNVEGGVRPAMWVCFSDA